MTYADQQSDRLFNQVVDRFGIQEARDILLYAIAINYCEQPGRRYVDYSINETDPNIAFHEVCHALYFAQTDQAHRLDLKNFGYGDRLKQELNIVSWEENAFEEFCACKIARNVGVAKLGNFFDASFTRTLLRVLFNRTIEQAAELYDEFDKRTHHIDLDYTRSAFEKLKQSVALRPHTNVEVAGMYPRATYDFKIEPKPTVLTGHSFDRLNSHKLCKCSMCRAARHKRHQQDLRDRQRRAAEFFSTQTSASQEEIAG